MGSRRPTETLQALRAAARLCPEDALYRYHLALALWRSGDQAAALEHVACAEGLAVRGSELETRVRRHGALLRALYAASQADHAPGEVLEGTPARASGAGFGAGTGPVGLDGPGSAATDAEAWRSSLARAIGMREGLPQATPEMPAWLAGLLTALQAAVAGQWEEAGTAAGSLLDDPDLPPVGRWLAEWVAAEAHAVGGRWGALWRVADAALPPAGASVGRLPWSERVRRLRHTAAAHVLAQTLKARDAALATAVWPRWADGATLPAEVMGRARATMGMTCAAHGLWREAVQLWSAAGSAPEVLQALAIAYERIGRQHEAVVWWRRVWDHVRREGTEGLACVRGVPPTTVSGAVAAHIAELLEEAHDVAGAVDVVAEALADPRTELAPSFCLWAARLRGPGSRSGPSDFERRIALLERGLAGVPDDVRGWEELAGLHRRAGHAEAAVAADLRWLALAPDPEEAGRWLVEDMGRAALAAWASADQEGAERYSARLAVDLLPQLPPQVQEEARVVADLAAAVWERARQTPRPRSMRTWDRWLHARQAGEEAPLCAYVFRGMLSLLGGHPQAAERWFQEVRDSDVWARRWKDRAADEAAYYRWIGWAHCWARQVRATACPARCAEHCSSMWPWLSLATVVNAASPPPLAPPPVLAACGELPPLYSLWTKTDMRIHHRMQRFDPDEDPFGEEVQADLGIEVAQFLEKLHRLIESEQAGSAETEAVRRVPHLR
jgi:tetratricopeptide (TPR) repeat protein